MGDSTNKIPVITSTPEVINTPQNFWDDQWFNQTVEAHGYDVNIERAMKCPCKEEATGQARSHCMNCGGSGWFFIDLQKSKLLCSSMSNKSKYEQWTEANMGTVNITTKPSDKLGFMDRITLTELESWFSQTIYLNQTNDDYFAFLVYEPIQIFEIYLYGGDGQALIYLDPQYYHFTKNKLTVDKTYLQTINHDQKPCLSIRYTHCPTYYIIDVNRDLIKQKSNKQCSTDGTEKKNYVLNCVGRRAHYVLDAPNYNGERLFDNTNYEKPPIKYDY